MARNALISFFDWAQYPGVSISVSAGSFLAGFPAENMLILQPQYAARASGTAITFTIDLTTPRTIGMVHLQNLVTASNGTIQVTFGTYNSGVVNSWATDASGVYSQNLYTALGRPRVFIPPAPVVASTVTIAVNGVTVDPMIGFVGVCEIFEPPNDLLIGPIVTVLDESDLQVVPFGSTYITARGKRRKIDFSLPPIEDGNVAVVDQFVRAFDLAMINGKSSPVIVAKYPDDTFNLERNAVWGTISNDVPFTNRFYGYHDIVFQVKQLI